MTGKFRHVCRARNLVIFHLAFDRVLLNAGVLQDGGNSLYLIKDLGLSITGQALLSCRHAKKYTPPKGEGPKGHKLSGCIFGEAFLG